MRLEGREVIVVEMVFSKGPNAMPAA